MCEHVHATRHCNLQGAESVVQPTIEDNLADNLAESAHEAQPQLPVEAREKVLWQQPLEQLLERALPGSPTVTQDVAEPSSIKVTGCSRK